MNMLFRDKNYIGPVKEVLQFGQQRRSSHSCFSWPFLSTWRLSQKAFADPKKVLDLGTGNGNW
jgi:ubiquinone/menaquinone biosynthesis C-methylase UbiE